MDCEYLDQCLFFNNKVPDMPSTTRVLKIRYCTGGGNRACARFIIGKKLGKEKIPEDLCPNQLDRLEELLGFL